MLCRMLPAALTAPFIAVISDRRPRRQVMLTADLVRVGLMSAIALIAAADGPPALAYGLAGVSGMFSAAFTPAEAAILPGLARFARRADRRQRHLEHDRERRVVRRAGDRRRAGRRRRAGAGLRLHSRRLRLVGGDGVAHPGAGA